jgi:hypothetical protein
MAFPSHYPRPSAPQGSAVLVLAKVAMQASGSAFYAPDPGANGPLYRRGASNCQQTRDPGRRLTTVKWDRPIPGNDASSPPIATAPFGRRAAWSAGTGWAPH